MADYEIRRSLWQRLKSRILQRNKKQLMIKQLQEIEQKNIRKQIAKIIYDHQDTCRISTPNAFIPFTAERNGIGKLIFNRETKSSLHLYASTEKSKKKTVLNPQISLTDKTKRSNQTIEKMFANLNVAKDKIIRETIKYKLVSNDNLKNNAPPVGYYDSLAMSKIKFHKPILFEIHQAHTIKEDNWCEAKDKINTKISKQKSLKVSQQKRMFNGQNKKIQINFNLPELKKYHSSKLLNFKVCSNFEENHNKFKQRARYSQMLAIQIKKQLEQQD